ncbi:hypothetical protein ACFU5O_04680 [Streptomyces sp. NPDC057445]|uniref:WXG100 family type VII secretion target n=1 Tax=Streptomyces sp. NPDC057445 TaxID=3346136 RepID=UPI003685F97B
MAESGAGGGLVGGFLGRMFVSTDFESHTHAELLAMVASANPDTIKGHADQLADAAKAITEIGEDLKAYVTAVKWKGEAAEAFVNWGEQTSLATIKLGEYSAVGGKWMGNAAQTLVEVKANLPKVDADAKQNLDAALKYHNDPDSRTLAQEARAKLDGDHAEAVQQMNKLAQSYTFSAMFIHTAEAPTFPAPPESFVPKGHYGSESVVRDGTYAGGGGTAGSGYSSSNPTSSFRPDPVTSAPVHLAPAPSLDRPADMEINSLETLPQSSQSPATATPPSVPPAGRPEVGTTPPVGMVPPALTGRTGGPGPVAGRPGIGGVRPPALPGAGPLGTGPGAARMPQGNGIVGGRPVPQNSGRPTGGIPRGTVIGGEGMHGRPPMGAGPGGGMQGVPGGQGGFNGGRRLGYEAGGMVGGRAQQPGAAAARPFTPGGTGLVRGADSAGASRAGQAGSAGRSGMTSHSTRGTGSHEEERRGKRPDYLSEDEETWQQGNRRVAPPVID